MNLSRTSCAFARRGATALALPLAAFAQTPPVEPPAKSRGVVDPNLRPEKSWTTELTAEKDLGNALLRLTFFTENVRDSLYSQTTFDPIANANISRAQNVGRIKTQGVEAAFSGSDVLKKGLDLSGSVTYADSRIKDQVNRQWSAAVGIDNLNNYPYRNFHPYPQRTFMAELNFSL